MMNTNLTKNILKVMSRGNEPFYASDLGMNGGEINGVDLHGYIAPTGNTRPVEITLQCWDYFKGLIEVKKTVQAKEWRYVSIDEKYSDPAWDSVREYIVAERERDLGIAIAQAREIVALADALGL